MRFHTLKIPAMLTQACLTAGLLMTFAALALAQGSIPTYEQRAMDRLTTRNEKSELSSWTQAVDETRWSPRLSEVHGQKATPWDIAELSFPGDLRSVKAIRGQVAPSPATSDSRRARITKLLVFGSMIGVGTYLAATSEGVLRTEYRGTYPLGAGFPAGSFGISSPTMRCEMGAQPLPNEPRCYDDTRGWTGVGLSLGGAIGLWFALR